MLNLNLVKSKKKKKTKFKKKKTYGIYLLKLTYLPTYLPTYFRFLYLPPILILDLPKIINVATWHKTICPHV
jgi:hypothetical protein